jgi:outer membrane protein assembly factor BamB
MKRSLLLALIVVWSARAEDVPQFRGAGGLGISSEKNLPVTWSNTENVRWKAELPGRGLSNPVISGGRVFVTAASRAMQDRLHVLCFDQRTGKLLWERQFWATSNTLCHPKTNMAAPTPIVDGKNVYALFATADLVCLDHDGNLQWARSLVGDYPTVGNNVGMAASPVLAGDAVVVHMENAGESFAVAIDRTTGQNRWLLDRPRVINWNTPFVHNADGQTQLLLMTPKELTAHHPENGKKIWSFSPGGLSTSPSVVAGEGLLFVPGSKLTALRPGSDGVEPEVVWQNPKLNPGFASPVLLKGRIYTVTNGGIVSCAEARTGKIVWTHRLDGAYAASPLAAEGRLYFVSEGGVTTVLEDGGAEPKVLAANELTETILASPVASGGAIFLRSDQHLWCLAK